MATDNFVVKCLLLAIEFALCSRHSMEKMEMVLVHHHICSHHQQ